MDFHQIFRICLPEEDLELTGFLWVSGNNYCHGKPFKYLCFSVLNFLIEPGLGVYEMSCMRLSHFYTILYISFIYEDIFTNFAEKIYGCESMSVKNFVLNLKNNMATIVRFAHHDSSKIVDMS